MSISEFLPAPSEPLRLLAVHAHPDDEASKGAATVAMYVDQGVEVLIVTCTGGERGDILNPSFELGDRNLTQVRREEMQNSVAVLGVAHRWLGFIDSGYPDGDPKPPVPEDSFAAQPLEVPGKLLVEIVREFRPHVMTTYDENGGYPHPDHIRTHEVAMFAFENAGNADFESAGSPWTVAKIYYHHSFSQKRIRALHEACLAQDLPSPYEEWLERFTDPDKTWSRITTQVPVSDYFEIRDQALLAHATQIDPAGNWFGVPLEIQKAIWPTEDYELAVTRLASTVVDFPETDLFHGIRS